MIYSLWQLSPFVNQKNELLFYLTDTVYLIESSDGSEQKYYEHCLCSAQHYVNSVPPVKKEQIMLVPRMSAFSMCPIRFL